MVSSLAPTYQDTNSILLEKILRLCNQLNGGPVSDPDYFPEGSTPLRGDTINISLQKICGSLYGITTGGGGVYPPVTGSYIYTGSGDPNGSQTADAGSIYFDISTPSSPVQWIKTTNGSNTGWI